MATKSGLRTRAVARARAERETRLAMDRACVATGKCPSCGEAIRRNSSLTGWYECSQRGAEGFRKDSSKPECSWQVFTE